MFGNLRKIFASDKKDGFFNGWKEEEIHEAAKKSISFRCVCSTQKVVETHNTPLWFTSLILIAYPCVVKNTKCNKVMQSLFEYKI